jgi:hypothetical protein
MSTLSIDQMPSRADQTFGIGNVLDEEFKPSLGLTSSSQQFARYTPEPAAPLSASLEAGRLTRNLDPQSATEQAGIFGLSALNLGQIHSLLATNYRPLGLQMRKSTEVWDEADEARFDALVEMEALDRISDGEANELVQLSLKRDRLVLRVPLEEVQRETKRTEALLELQRVIEKYAPLFARKS